MPLKNGKPHCVNHPDTELRVDKGVVNVIPTAELIPTGLKFSTITGAPIKVFVCPTCDYMELYWDRATVKSVRELVEKPKPEQVKVGSPAAAGNLLK